MPRRNFQAQSAQTEDDLLRALSDEWRHLKRLQATEWRHLKRVQAEIVAQFARIDPAFVDPVTRIIARTNTLLVNEARKRFKPQRQVRRPADWVEGWIKFYLSIDKPRASFAQQGEARKGRGRPTAPPGVTDMREAILFARVEFIRLARDQSVSYACRVLTGEHGDYWRVSWVTLRQRYYRARKRILQRSRAHRPQLMSQLI
jgi:hypothetical protein